MLFGSVLTTKWFVTQEINGTTYYLSASDNAVRHLVWTQQLAKALKFDSSSDAEKIMEVVKSHHKNNKKAVFKVK